MKKKTLITTLILFFFTTLISATPIINADEMFFADFYVVDARGTPLNGVEIEVTGIYNYYEIVYTESNGYATRLALFSDQRNAHYTWKATYQNASESGDFYVPNNYNAVNIVMSDVDAPTPTPHTTQTPASSPTPATATTPSPTQTPTPKPKPQEDPPILLIAIGATIIVAVIAILAFTLKKK
jgi:hypothetical protein